MINEEICQRFYNLIDKEKNIYELSELYEQNRYAVSSYLNILKDPYSEVKLKLENDTLTASKKYKIVNNVPDFTNNSSNSKEWNRLNNQFMNYHKSLSAYTLLNSSPIVNYLSIKTKLGLKKNIKVLDVGGGTGHTFASFFHFPETIQYFLIDPNIRLLHDQFIRVFPKLSYLKMAHILANAENLPILDNQFDLVLSIEAIDHLNNYKEFISEAYRVLNKGGQFLLTSHLDIAPSKEDETSFLKKIFSNTFLERCTRYLFYRKHKVGSDDHTLHIENPSIFEEELKIVGFKLIKKEIFKKYFYLIAEK